jgi:hypothetical protein
MITRREFGLTVAGLMVTGGRSLRGLQAVPSSVVSGVHLGVQTYSFREMPRPAGAPDSVLEPQQAAWLGKTIANHTPRFVNLEQYMDTFQVTTFADSGEVVRPRDGSFAKVRSIVANVFSQAAVAAN